MKNSDKKTYVELDDVKTFINSQSEGIQLEYRAIVKKLKQDGRLNMPFGEKITGKNLFAIRVIQAGNIRVFYVYGINERIFGIHGYVKKTQQIPQHEMKKALKISKLLKERGMI